MKNFDRFIGIDWSGAKSPIHTKSIAVSQCDFGDDAPILISKKWSRQLVGDYIKDLTKDSKRTLIGIDCNFGYAKDIIHKQLGDQAAAHDLWRLIDSICADDPNYFAGKFWTESRYKSDFWTHGKMPDNFNMPRRKTEQICGESGYGWPESPFKLIGAKQVGKGGMAGMRMAHDLKAQCGNKIAIWPFDDGDICNISNNVITEIYPRQFIKRVGMGNQKIRSEADLNKALEKLGSNDFHDDFNSDHDTDAIIAAAGLRYLCGRDDVLPKHLSNPKASPGLLKCEGWIFGAGY